MVSVAEMPLQFDELVVENSVFSYAEYTTDLKQKFEEYEVHESPQKMTPPKFLV